MPPTCSQPLVNPVEKLRIPVEIERVQLLDAKCQVFEQFDWWIANSIVKHDGDGPLGPWVPWYFCGKVGWVVLFCHGIFPWVQ